MPIRERRSFDQLHHQSADAVGRLRTRRSRAMLRMIQRGEDLRFALEAREPLGIGDERVGQDLDGDVPLQPRVARAIDFAHAAGAEGDDDLIRAESRAAFQ